MTSRLCCALFCLLLFCPNLCPAQVYQPGFRTIGIFNEDPPARMDVNIWYPSIRQPKELNFPPWILNGAAGAKPAEGRFPLLVLSHASPVDRFAYHYLGEYLAREGFIVAAPTHGRDYMNNMDDLFTWQQLTHRAGEIKAAIDYIVAQKDIADSVDDNRIGLIGFGSGATAALLLGGAVPDCASWTEYCRKAGRHDAYCSAWAVDRLNGLCQNFPLKQSLADTRIKAIAAVSPGFGMIFGSNSFENFRPPLLLVSAGSEKFNRPQLHSLAIAHYIGQRALFLDLPNADDGSLIAQCPPALAEDLPELCGSTRPEEKISIQNRLKEALLAFFSHYLIITANLPKISPPPDLSAQGQTTQTQSGP